MKIVNILNNLEEILLMGFSRQEYGSGLPFPFPVPIDESERGE